MRGEIPRIISLILILFLLSTTNVSAKPMSIMEGGVYRFERIRTMSCSQVTPYLINETEVGEKEITEIEYLITDINYEGETVNYNYSEGDISGSNSISISIDQLKDTFHPIYGITIYYKTEYLPQFIKPDFEEMNNLIRESLYREGDNYLWEATEVEFMGKDSIEKGAENLDSDNRRWSIYLHFQKLVWDRKHEPWEVKLWREWEYNRDGLLKYSKIKMETKNAWGGDWCGYESIFKNTDSIFNPLYGTEVNISLFLFLIPIIIIYLWIKRKKIPRIL